MFNEIKGIISISQYPDFEFQSVKKNIREVNGNQCYILTGRIKSTAAERIIYAIEALAITILSCFVALCFPQVREIWRNALFSKRQVEVLATQEQFVKYHIPLPSEIVLPKSEPKNEPKPSPTPFSVLPESPSPAESSIIISISVPNEVELLRLEQERLLDSVQSQPGVLSTLDAKFHNKAFLMECIKRNWHVVGFINPAFAESLSKDPNFMSDLRAFLNTDLKGEISIWKDSIIGTIEKTVFPYVLKEINKESLLQIIKDKTFLPATLRSCFLSEKFNDREVVLEMVNHGYFDFKHIGLWTFRLEFRDADPEAFRNKLYSFLYPEHGPKDEEMALACVRCGYNAKNEKFGTTFLPGSREFLVKLLAIDPSLALSDSFIYNEEVVKRLRDIDFIYEVYTKNRDICKYLNQYPTVSGSMNVEKLTKLKEIVLETCTTDRMHILPFPKVLRQNGDFLWEVFQKSRDLPSYYFKSNPAFSNKERVLAYIKERVRAIIQNSECIHDTLWKDSDIRTALLNCSARIGPVPRAFMN